MSVASVNTVGVSYNQEQDARSVMNSVGSSAWTSGGGMFAKDGSTGDKIGDAMMLAAPAAGPYAGIVAGVGALIKAIF